MLKLIVDFLHALFEFLIGHFEHHDHDDKPVYVKPQPSADDLNSQEVADNLNQAELDKMKK